MNVRIELGRKGIKALLFFLCIWATSAQAQQNCINIIDNHTGKPLEGAGVVCKELYTSAASSPILAISNQQGKAELNIKYPAIIEISFLGYANLRDTLSAPINKSYALEPLDQNMRAISITADYAPISAKNSIYDIKVIDKTKIEQKGANNLRELLLTQMGASLSQDNILGTGISQQGLGGENVKILIDGVPVLGRLNGNIDLSQINLNNVERVEIIEGPLSTSYGSNALGGVINVITNNNQQEKVQANLNTYWEHVGQYNVDGNVGLRFGKSLFQASGGRYFFNGFNTPDTARAKLWKPKEQYFGDAAYTFRSNHFTAKFKGAAYYELLTNRGELRAPFYINAFDDYYRTWRYTGSSDMTARFNKNKSINVRAAYSYYKREKTNYFKDMTTLENTLTGAENQDTSIFQQVTARAVYAMYAPEKKLSYQAGIDIDQQFGKGGRIAQGTQSIGDYAFFSGFDWKPNKQWAIRPSARISYNTRYASPVIPSLNIRFQPIKDVSLRAAYARGFRAPDIKELYFHFVDINHHIIGNPNLKAETSNHAQVSIDYYHKFGKHEVELSGGFFFNDVNNLIRLASSDASSYTYINQAKSRTMGGNVEMNYHAGGLNLNAGAMITAIYSDFGNGIKTNGYEYVPTFNFEALYHWKKAGMDFSIFNKFTGKQPGVYIANSSELRSNFMSAYNIMDISFSKYFIDKTVRITLGGKNLFNVTNISASGQFNSSGVHSIATQSLPVGWGASFFAALHINIGSNLFHKKDHAQQ